jgi:hypothetical protein
MTEIEKKANALVNDVRVERILYPISLVQRLRRTYRKEYAPTRSMCGDNSNKPFPFPILATEVPVNPDGHEAADRIEALTAENQRLLVSNEQWQVDYNEAVIDKLELETENERLLQIAQRLGTYSAHDDRCRIMTHGVWSDPIPCTCGYTDAWQALAALEKQP